MTIEDIIKKYFKDHPDIQGLVCSDAECGCSRDDLFPCGETPSACEVAEFKCVQPHCKGSEFDELFCSKNPETCILKKDAIQEAEESE